MTSVITTCNSHKELLLLSIGCQWNRKVFFFQFMPAMLIPYRGTTLWSSTLVTNQASRKNFHWCRRPSGTTPGRKRFKVSVTGPLRVLFVFQMIQEVSNQKTIVCQDNLKLHFLLDLHYDMCFQSFCIGLIRYLFNCTGKWLQNSSTDKLICHWMASNIIGPECSNLVEAASNVFACPGLDDGAVTSTLPADLVSTIIKRFTFEGNWILDLIRSKGSFSHIASIWKT